MYAVQKLSQSNGENGLISHFTNFSCSILSYYCEFQGNGPLILHIFVLAFSFLLVLGLAGAMSLSLLAGCGGGNGGGQSSNGGDAPAASGDKVIKIGVFEPSTGDSASGGKKEMLGMQFANSEAPTMELNGETYNIELIFADQLRGALRRLSAGQRRGLPGPGFLRFRRLHRRRPHLQ